MGTAKTVPYWVAEVQLMEQFGWTEKQLYEEVSKGMVQRIGVLNEIRARAAKWKEGQQQTALSHPGAKVSRETLFRR